VRGRETYRVENHGLATVEGDLTVACGVAGHTDANDGIIRENEWPKGEGMGADGSDEHGGSSRRHHAPSSTHGVRCGARRSRNNKTVGLVVSCACVLDGAHIVSIL
jgi:hypothetical protein